MVKLIQNGSGPERQGNGSTEGIEVLDQTTVESLMPDDFIVRYFDRRIPVIIRGGMNFLGKAAEWDLDLFTYLFGELPIGVLKSSGGKARYAYDNRPVHLRFSEFAEIMAAWTPHTYDRYGKVQGGLYLSII